MFSGLPKCSWGAYSLTTAFVRFGVTVGEDAMMFYRFAPKLGAARAQRNPGQPITYSGKREQWPLAAIAGGAQTRFRKGDAEAAAHSISASVKHRIGRALLRRQVLDGHGPLDLRELTGLAEVDLDGTKLWSLHVARGEVETQNVAHRT
jgi:hypothetical protein